MTTLNHPAAAPASDYTVSGYHLANAGNPANPSPLSRAGADSLEGLQRAQAMRTLTPLPKRTEEIIDDAVIRVGRERLVVADDLISDPRRRTMLPNWMAVPTMTSHKQAESGRARQGMYPTPQGERQIKDMTSYTVPIYVTFDYFSFSRREVLAAARNGYMLDTTHVEQATRNVLEQIEDTTINGDLTVDGNTINGMMDSTNTFSYESNDAWDAAGKTGQNIVTDFLSAVSVLRADKFYGPYDIYLPLDYDTTLNNPWSDGTTTFDRTIRNFLESMNLNGPVRVRAADQLADDRVLVVDRGTPGVSRMVVGQQPSVLSFDSIDGMVKHFYIVACMIPIIQSNSESNFGIAVGNTS